MDYVEHKQNPNKSNPTYQVMALGGIGFVGAPSKHFENYRITMERVSELRNLKLLMDQHMRGTFIDTNNESCRSQWSRGLKHGSAAARLLKLWVRIPLRAWMSVSCDCCVLLGRSLCVGLITRPKESCRLWCVVVCDLETS